MSPAYTACVQPSPTPEGPSMGLLQILPVGRFPSAPENKAQTLSSPPGHRQSGF